MTVGSTAAVGPSPAAGLCCWVQSLGCPLPRGPLATRSCRHKPPRWGRGGDTHRTEPAGCPPAAGAAYPAARFSPLLLQPCPSPALLENELTQKTALWLCSEWQSRENLFPSQTLMGLGITLG